MLQGAFKKWNKPSSDQRSKPSAMRSRKARVGQGIFLENLMAFLDQRLYVISRPPLRAYSVPRISRHGEIRTASTSTTAAFDAGLISLADDGRLLASPFLDRENFQHLGLREYALLSHVEEAHRAYLHHHRRASGFEGEAW